MGPLPKEKPWPSLPLLYAVHPIHTEAVAWAVGRAELLAAGFLFAGWILHLRDRPVASLACFALAMLSKESAIAFFPLVLLRRLRDQQVEAAPAMPRRPLAWRCSTSRCCGKFTEAASVRQTSPWWAILWSVFQLSVEEF